MESLLSSTRLASIPTWLRLLSLAYILFHAKCITLGKHKTSLNEWASWSSCSAVCGPGISTRTRVCPQYGFSVRGRRNLFTTSGKCSGSSTKYRVCVSKPCPADNATAHEKACSQFNTRKFSGRQFLWEPFIHPTGPCRVSCRAKGQHFYANLANRVQDGASCSTGLVSAVCVRGVCKTVGCDGVLESAAAKDRCDVCNGDGTSCRIISGIFTSTDLKRGTHYILSIPSGSTHINITELETSTNLLILQTVDGKAITSNVTNNNANPRLVEAAGAIFKHEMRSSSNRRETITSSGPTNTTVVLQLQVRGANPGIMYTFSVPEVVADSIIEQIRERSKQTEPHPKYKSPHQSSHIHDDANSTLHWAYSSKHNLTNLTRNYNWTRETDSRKKFNSEEIKSSYMGNLPQDYSKQTSVEGNLEQRASTLGEDSHSQPQRVGIQSSVINSTDKSESRVHDSKHSPKVLNRDIDVEPATHVPPSHATRGTSLHTSNSFYSNTNAEKRASLLATQEQNAHYSRLNKHMGLEQNNKFNKFNYKETDTEISMDKVIENRVKKGNNKDILDDNDFVDYRTNLTHEEIEKIRNVLKDHEMNFDEDFEGSFKLEVPGRPVQSFNKALNSVADLRGFGSLDHESADYDDKKIRSSQNSHTESSSLLRSHQMDIEGAKTDKEGAKTEKEVAKIDKEGAKPDKEVAKIDKEGAKPDKEVAKIDKEGAKPDKEVAKIDKEGAKTDQEGAKTDKEVANRKHSHPNLNKIDDNSRGRSAKDTSHRRMHNSILAESVISSKPDTSNGNIEGKEEMNHTASSSPVSDEDRLFRSEYLHKNTIYEQYKNEQQQESKDKRSKRPNSTEPEIRLHHHRQSGFRGSSAEASSTIVEELTVKSTSSANGSPNIRTASTFDSSTGLASRDTHSKPREQSSKSRKAWNTQEIMRNNTQEGHGEQTSSIPDSKTTDVNEKKNPIKKQQQLYNERLREFKEILRQKQAELEASHKHNLHHGNNRAQDKKLGFEKIYERKQENIEAGYSTLPARTKNKASLSIALTTNPTPPSIDTQSENYNLKQEVQGNPDENGSRHRQLISQTNPSFRNEHKGTRTNSHTVAAYKHATVTSTPNGAWQRLIPVKQTQMSEHLSKEYIVVDPVSHVNDRDPQFQTSDSPASVDIEPEIITWTHQDHIETADETNSHTGLTRALKLTPGQSQQHWDNPRSSLLLPGSDVTQGPLLNQGSRSRQTSTGQRSQDVYTRDEIMSLPKKLQLKVDSTGYDWKVSGLTECTLSCGGGIQETVAVCVDTLTQAVVTDENCGQVQKPVLLTVPCNKRPCSAVWTPGPWSACTVSCGTGDQVRTVTCQARVSPTLNLTMPPDTCHGQGPIADRQACSNGPCSSWRLGDWSNCSAKCGDGIKTRDVCCTDLENNTLSDVDCVEARPHSEKLCNLGKCGRGWFFTDWTQECSAQCGTGVLTRDVVCAGGLGGSCDSSSRPSQNQPCAATQRCGGSWVTGGWSKCEAKCGPGKRRRKVLCVREHSGVSVSVVSDDGCDEGDKPVDVEDCELRPCVPEWYITSWSECSRTCGTGYQTREVKCLGPDKAAAGGACSIDTRPKAINYCNTHGCGNVVTDERHPQCVDTHARCTVAKSAQLCRFGYFQQMCCQSCADQQRETRLGITSSGVS